MNILSVQIQGAQTTERYPVYIGDGIFLEAVRALPLGHYSRIAVVTDEHVAPLWLDRFAAALPHEPATIVIPAGEEAKDIKTVQYVWRELLQAGFDRHSLVLNLGGGMTGDLGGFAAATYMRGIDFIQVPTTLLAQVDASVGGKVGVNFAELKNMVGVFQQPKAVIVDVSTLESLPERELRAGFAEVIKHAAIKDKQHFADLGLMDFTARSPRQLAALVRRSCEIKAEVVAADEKERGVRKILNFGHTAGHAIEISSHLRGHPLLHGEAVALGMRVAAGLSCRVSCLPEHELQGLIALLERCGLPTRVPFKITAEELAAKMVSDKKSRAGSMKWVLLHGLGDAVFDAEVDDELVLDALRRIC